MSKTKSEAAEPQLAGFEVHLENFTGPFDLLLQLISRHEMDVTEVALHRVTDEFIAYVRAGGAVWDLERTSSFLVVAATLLDLKTARLLPGAEVTDPEDLAALEARDLLFARLLQYRAFKQLAQWLAAAIESAAGLHWRPGGLEERFESVLPEVELGITVDELAALAAQAMTPKPPPVVELTHIHGAQVSVADQTEQLARRLQDNPAGETFRALVSGCDRLTTVVRFLAVLELYRADCIAIEQAGPLTELHLRWTGNPTAEVPVVDEYETQPELEGS